MPSDVQNLPDGHGALHAEHALLPPSWYSQPLAGLLSQFPCVGLQAPSAQTPAVQVAVALANEHTFPQPLQLLGSLWRLTHAPLQ